MHSFIKPPGYNLTRLSSLATVAAPNFRAGLNGAAPENGRAQND